MAISFKEQIDNFSNDFYINTAYIPYIVNGPECADGLSADELKKIDDFLDKWSYVDCSEAMLDSPDFGECHICGMQAAVTKATFINKEAVREEEQKMDRAVRGGSDRHRRRGRLYEPRQGQGR